MREWIETEDLVLKLPDAAYADSVADYYLRNRAFLAEFEPLRLEDFYTAKFQKAALEQEREQAVEGNAFTFYLFIKNREDMIIGSIGLNNIVMGCFCSCFMGYKLDEMLQGRGYMTQAVLAAVQYAFEELGLHRVEANVMPRNQASLRVLEKCGFQNEGISRKYLKINGIWEDHIHMVRLNEED